MTIMRYTAAELPRDLTDSWAHTVGTTYLHAVQLDPDLLYLNIPLGAARSEGFTKVGRVGVFVEPADHAGLAPANFPAVSAYGVAQDGTATLLGSANDSDLSGFFYEQPHVIGQMPVCGSTPPVGGAHVHASRGLLLGGSAGLPIANYWGLQLRIQNESGADAVLGLKVHSVEITYG